MLTGKGRRSLRAQAHHLDAVVQVGHEGITENVLAQVDAALAAHELIKVRLDAEATEGKDGAAALLAERCRAELVQLIGHIAVLYRRRSKRPKVQILPPVPTDGAEPGQKPKRRAGSKGHKPKRLTHARKRHGERGTRGTRVQKSQRKNTPPARKTHRTRPAPRASTTKR